MTQSLKSQLSMNKKLNLLLDLTKITSDISRVTVSAAMTGGAGNSYETHVSIISKSNIGEVPEPLRLTGPSDFTVDTPRGQGIDVPAASVIRNSLNLQGHNGNSRDNPTNSIRSAIMRDSVDYDTMIRFDLFLTHEYPDLQRAHQLQGTAEENLATVLRRHFDKGLYLSIILESRFRVEYDESRRAIELDSPIVPLNQKTLIAEQVIRFFLHLIHDEFPTIKYKIVATPGQTLEEVINYCFEGSQFHTYIASSSFTINDTDIVEPWIIDAANNCIIEGQLPIVFSNDLVLEFWRN